MAQRNWWKIGFFTMAAACLAVIAIGTYMLLDAGVTITYMQQGYADANRDLSAMSSLVDHSFVGVAKTEMIPLLQKAYPGDLVKDEGQQVMAGQLTFQFDEAGKFVRILHPQ